jgi:hypothetical protein
MGSPPVGGLGRQITALKNKKHVIKHSTGPETWQVLVSTGTLGSIKYEKFLHQLSNY